MENDRPISNLKSDKLRRKNFINALANEIQNDKNGDCSVIGIYGPWGSGKTSLISLLEENLNKKYFFTAYFNPWRYKSEDILLKELFQIILKGVQSDKKLESKVQQLGTLFDEYSQFITIPRVSFWGITFNLTNPARALGKGIGKLLNRNNNFENKKQQINNILKDLALPVVVFIDDVDRLDINEIQALFKIIKLTADFNNLIYIISFDEDIVSKALAKNYGNGDIVDGKNFLEKIVQLPLRVPYINNQERFEYTIEILNDWLDKQAIITPEKYQNEFLSVFKRFHDIFIKNPRDSKRLLNTISFSYKCLKDEVCLYDIILLESIRIFSPLLFNEITNHKRHLFSNTGNIGGFAINNEGNIVKEEFKKKIATYSGSLEVVELIINFLFPFNAIFKEGVGNNTEKVENLFKHQRVGAQKYFDRFIEFNIGKQDISDSEFKEITKTFNSKKHSDLNDQITRLTTFPKDAIITLLFHSEEELSDQGKMNMAILLATKKHFYKETSFEGRIFNRSAELTLKFLSLIDEARKAEALTFIFDKCESPQHVSYIVNKFERGIGKYNEFKFEPVALLNEKAKQFYIKIQEISANLLFQNVDEEKNDLLFIMIEKYGNLEKLKISIENFIDENPLNSLLVMKSLIPLVYINFSKTGIYDNEISNDRFKAIEYYVKRDVLLNAIYKSYPDLKEHLPQMSFNKNTEDNRRIVIQYLHFCQNN